MDYKNYSVNAASSLMSRIFFWMSLALTVTGVIAYFLSESPVAMNAIMHHPELFFGIFIAQLALIFGMNYGFSRLSYAALLSMFLLYAALTGTTFSVLFLIYQIHSLAFVFFITAGMFLSMALYGSITRHDLTSMGSLLGMTVWGLMLALIVNMFFKSTLFDTVLSFLGIIIFAGLTAFDVQKLKHLSDQGINDKTILNKISLIGACTLYLDFLNMFLFALQLFGKKKDSQ